MGNIKKPTAYLQPVRFFSDYINFLFHYSIPQGISDTVLVTHCVFYSSHAPIAPAFAQTRLFEAQTCARCRCSRARHYENFAIVTSNLYPDIAFAVLRNLILFIFQTFQFCTQAFQFGILIFQYILPF